MSPFSSRIGAMSSEQKNRVPAKPKKRKFRKRRRKGSRRDKKKVGARSGSNNGLFPRDESIQVLGIQNTTK